MEIKRKYNSSFRQTIKTRIGKLENRNDYKYIYKLIKNKKVIAENTPIDISEPNPIVLKRN